MTNIESEIALQDKKFTATIEKIRTRNFSKNLPFLMLSDKLPEGQGFYEYADGHIEIQEVYTIGAEIETRLVRRLSDSESNTIRQQYRRENGLL
jgi:hypothetical protein